MQEVIVLKEVSEFKTSLLVTAPSS